MNDMLLTCIYTKRSSLIMNMIIVIAIMLKSYFYGKTTVIIYFVSILFLRIKL